MLSDDFGNATELFGLIIGISLRMEVYVAARALSLDGMIHIIARSLPLRFEAYNILSLIGFFIFSLLHGLDTIS